MFTIAPHGSTDKLPYVTMGSGSLAAMAVFESFWRADMTRADAIELVCQAIEAGIFNDLGCVVRAMRGGAAPCPQLAGVASSVR